MTDLTNLRKLFAAADADKAKAKAKEKDMVVKYLGKHKGSLDPPPTEMDKNPKKYNNFFEAKAKAKARMDSVSGSSISYLFINRFQTHIHRG